MSTLFRSDQRKNCARIQDHILHLFGLEHDKRTADLDDRHNKVGIGVGVGVGVVVVVVVPSDPSSARIFSDVLPNVNEVFMSISLTVRAVSCMWGRGGEGWV